MVETRQLSLEYSLDVNEPPHQAAVISRARQGAGKQVAKTLNPKPASPAIRGVMEYRNRSLDKL